MEDYEFKFDDKILQAQRAARKMVKRDTKILATALLGSLILLCVLQNWFPLIFILLFLPLIVSFYMANNWRQWTALIINQLRCPHCGQLLAEHINLFFSPSPDCRYCGKVALASIKQLEQNG